MAPSSALLTLLFLVLSTFTMALPGLPLAISEDWPNGDAISPNGIPRPNSAPPTLTLSTFSEISPVWTFGSTVAVSFSAGQGFESTVTTSVTDVATTPPPHRTITLVTVVPESTSTTVTTYTTVSPDTTISTTSSSTVTNSGAMPTSSTSRSSTAATISMTSSSTPTATKSSGAVVSATVMALAPTLVAGLGSLIVVALGVVVVL